MVCALLTAAGQRWTCVGTQTLREVDCERGWKEELKYLCMFTVVTITTLPFHTDIMRSPTQMYLLAKIQHERENSFPEITHAVSCPSPLVFLVFLARSPAYFSPPDNNGPWKSRVSLYCLSCPASVFRMSEHNIIIWMSFYYFACITRCFCMLLLGQWGRKLSKVKLAASPTHGMACCEKCGNEIFDQCGNCNRCFGIWEMGTKQRCCFFFFFTRRLEHQGR